MVVCLCVCFPCRLYWRRVASILPKSDTQQTCHPALTTPLYTGSGRASSTTFPALNSSCCSSSTPGRRKRRRRRRGERSLPGPGTRSSSRTPFGHTRWTSRSGREGANINTLYVDRILLCFLYTYVDQLSEGVYCRNITSCRFPARRSWCLLGSPRELVLESFSFVFSRSGFLSLRISLRKVGVYVVLR